MNQTLRLFHFIKIFLSVASPLRYVGGLLALVALSMTGSGSVIAQQRSGVTVQSAAVVSKPVDVQTARLLSEAERDGFGANGANVAAPDEVGLLDQELAPQEAAGMWSDLLAVDDQQSGGPTATGYELHRKWGVNGLRDDRFAGANSGVYRARAAARLANGQVVVVGDIQLSSGGPRELGVVKYDSRGQRVAWSNASATYGLFSNQYLRFPGSDPWAGATVYAVNDVRVRGANIYALVTKRLPDNRYVPGIVRFLDDGTYLGGAEFAPDGGVNRDAVAMDIDRSGGHMIVLGRRSISTTPDGGFWTARLTIDTNGGLTLGAITTFQAGQRHLPADVAFERFGTSIVFPAPTSYYVAYSRNLGTTSESDHDPCIANIGSNNALDTGFGSGGVQCLPFDLGGNNVDLAVALYNRGWGAIGDNNEALYLVASVERAVTNGVGIVNLTNGMPDGNFGPQGERVYGGCSVNNFSGGAGCGVQYLDGVSRTHLPTAVYSSADLNGVFVAGASATAGTSRPMMMDIDASDGTLRTLQSFSSVSGSRFTSLVRRNGTGEFTMAGWGADAEGAANPYFLSAHLVKRNDLIFYDGLQSP
jgi:hypothetical protein